MSPCFTSPNYRGYNFQQIFGLVMWNRSPKKGFSDVLVKAAKRQYFLARRRWTFEPRISWGGKTSQHFTNISPTWQSIHQSKRSPFWSLPVSQKKTLDRTWWCKAGPSGFGLSNIFVLICIDLLNQRVSPANVSPSTVSPRRQNQVPLKEFDLGARDACDPGLWGIMSTWEVETPGISLVSPWCHGKMIVHWCALQSHTRYQCYHSLF